MIKKVVIMKKPSADKSGTAKSENFRHNMVFLLFLSVVLSISIPSCGKTGGDTSVVIPDISSATDTSLQPAAGNEVVLIRGNYWITGIPGFGANGFSALSGEYRFQPAGGVATSPGNITSYGSGREGDFLVYVTRDVLYFSGEWQNRPGTGNSKVYQRSGEEGFLAAAILDDSRENSWVAILRFPKGLEGAGINGDVFDKLLRAWTTRLLYFLSLSKTPGDVSLPAVLDF